MTPTDEEIDRLKADANWLFDSVREYHRTAHGSDTQETGLWAVAERIEKAADVLLALKARAEAAEQRVKELEAVLERIAKESMDYQYVAQAALEAKP